MVSLHLNNPSLLALSPAMLTAMSNHVNKQLPAYARPRFIRVQKEMQMTSTFKQQKTHLVREGFDVTKIQDPLYYLNVRSKTYEPLDQSVYSSIMSGKIGV